jgi:hypothetical protein
MASPYKRDGPAEGTPKSAAKKHSSTFDRELVGLQSPLGLQGVPLGSRRNVTPEDEKPESGIQDGGSIILNYDDLSASVQSLACGKCGKRKLLSTKKTLGLATRLAITCQNCYHAVTTLPKKRFPVPGYQPPVQTEGQVQKESFDDFQINVIVVMLCQELDKGEARYLAIRSGLDIQSPNLVNYSRVEQMISKQAIRLGYQIIRENVKREVEATRTDPSYTGDHTDGRCGLTVGVDGGWTQRQSGRAYNPDTGQISMIGTHVLAIWTLVCTGIFVIAHAN